MHKGCFRNPSFGRCPLVTDLAGTNLPDKADGKALQDSHCYAGEKHMHFNGADCIQYLPAGVGVVTIRISQNHAEGLFFIENFQLSSHQ